VITAAGEALSLRTLLGVAMVLQLQLESDQKGLPEGALGRLRHHQQLLTRHIDEPPGRRSAAFSRWYGCFQGHPATPIKIAAGAPQKGL